MGSPGGRQGIGVKDHVVDTAAARSTDSLADYVALELKDVLRRTQRCLRDERAVRQVDTRPPSEQVIQISDRRLSADGRLVEDESAKAGVLTCSNARLAFGFTGLARMGHFSTRDWLLDALYDCGPPGYDALGIAPRRQAPVRHALRLSGRS